jgi:DNA polymerase I-like protein with 3'-5' exonuclease and polymerase domains
MQLAELRAYFPSGVWLLDTEFATPVGDPVVPVCVVGRELFTGRCIQEFFDPNREYQNPFPLGPDALFVAYAAQAEWGCFLSLNWQLPAHVLDLYAEFRNEISGRRPPSGSNCHDTRLIGAMAYYGLDSISAVEKQQMQERTSRGHPFAADERTPILEYCKSDVDCLEKLLEAMAPTIELPYALFRGRYTKAVARIERAGIPTDRDCYERVVRNRERLKSRLIADFEAQHGPSPYIQNKQGVHRFNFRKLEAFLAQRGLLEAWEKTPRHRLATNEDYLQEMARKHAGLRPLADLVKRIADLRQFGLTIGSDSRARFPVMPFKADTGRNQPKAKQFVLAQSSWTRGFILAPPRFSVAYADWSAAEFAIAAWLSDDKAMQEAYASGDPYLDSAVKMSFAQPGATKQTDGTTRDVFKTWLLSAQNGVTAKSLVDRLPAELAERVPAPLATAEEFLEKHRKIYWRYWQWAEARVEIFMHEKRCEETIFGWRHRLNENLKDWQVRNQSLNFPVQATCAEILRWACIYATEEGIDVLAPVHDALLVGGPTDQIEEIVMRTQECMNRASELVLGTVMRTDVKIFNHPERFMDPRGAETWRSIMRMLDEVEQEEAASASVQDKTEDATAVL